MHWRGTVLVWVCRQRKTPTPPHRSAIRGREDVSDYFSPRHFDAQLYSHTVQFVCAALLEKSRQQTTCGFRAGNRAEGEIHSTHRPWLATMDVLTPSGSYHCTAGFCRHRWLHIWLILFFFVFVFLMLVCGGGFLTISTCLLSVRGNQRASTNRTSQTQNSIYA